MRKNAKKALDAFNVRKVCNQATIRSTGNELYSYNMLIARVTVNGIDLIEYNQAPSHTTKSHIRAVEEYYPKAILNRVHSFT